MKRLLWDTTLEPCEYPQIIKDIFFKESIKNRLTYTSWVGKISNRYKNDCKLTSEQIKSISDFRNKYTPYLIMYVLKDDTIVLVNEYNQEIIYQYKLSGEHANKKITTACLLDNDNIKLFLIR